MRRLATLFFIVALATPVFSQQYLNLKQWKVSDGGNDHWYAVFNHYDNWVKADSAAKTLSAPPITGLSGMGYLATIRTQAENDFIRDSVLAGTDQQTPTDLAWIGGSWRADLGNWAWETGEEFSFTNWLPSGPKGLGVVPEIGICGPKSGSDFGKWRDTITLNGEWSQWSVVEWGDPEGTVTPLPPRPNIRRIVQWKAENGGNNHWYGVLAEAVSWNAARDEAITLIPHPQSASSVGYLSTFNNREEHVWINSSDLISGTSSSPESRYWLGGYKHAITHEWIWDNGEAFTYRDPFWNEPASDVNTALSVQFTADPWLHYYSLWNWRLQDDLTGPNKFWSVIEWGGTEPFPYPTIAHTFNWPKEYWGNNHWYAVMTKCLSQDQAKAYLDTAQIPNPPGITGRPYLATVTTINEFGWIQSNLYDFGFSVPSDIDGMWMGGDYTGSLGSWETGESFAWHPWISPPPDSAATNLVYRNGGYYSRHFENGSGFPKPYVWSLLEWGTPHCGDVNGDLRVNVADITTFVSYLFNGGVLAEPINADGSGDGSVNVVDLTTTVQYLFADGYQLACPEW